MDALTKLRLGLQEIRTRSAAILTARWMMWGLLGLILYSSGVEVGYTRALASMSNIDRTDVKCRYGIQALLSHNLDVLDRELIEYYPLKWELQNATVSAEDTQRYDELTAKRKLYAGQLEKIQDACLKAIDAENNRR